MKRLYLFPVVREFKLPEVKSFVQLAVPGNQRFNESISSTYFTYFSSALDATPATIYFPSSPRFFEFNSPRAASVLNIPARFCQKATASVYT